jgi:hypothetical protein
MQLGQKRGRKPGTGAYSKHFQALDEGRTIYKCLLCEEDSTYYISKYRFQHLREQHPEVLATDGSSSDDEAGNRDAQEHGRGEIPAIQFPCNPISSAAAAAAGRDAVAEHMYGAAFGSSPGEWQQTDMLAGSRPVCLLAVGPLTQPLATLQMQQLQLEQL